jgi:hypothetical protein
MWNQHVVICIFGISLCLSAGAKTLAGPVVTVVPTGLGGGVFEYSLFVDNTTGLEPAEGLLLFNANTNFGLDSNSVIDAPLNWGFFPPSPPDTDQLSFFSFSSTADIPMGGTLGNFTFDSLRDPSTVSPSDFMIDLVGSTSGSDITTFVHIVPEPSALVLASTSALFLLSCIWARSRIWRLRASFQSRAAVL